MVIVAHLCEYTKAMNTSHCKLYAMWTQLNKDGFLFVWKRSEDALHHLLLFNADLFWLPRIMAHQFRTYSSDYLNRLFFFSVSVDSAEAFRVPSCCPFSTFIPPSGNAAEKIIAAIPAKLTWVPYPLRVRLSPIQRKLRHMRNMDQSLRPHY